MFFPTAQQLNSIKSTPTVSKVVEQEQGGQLSVSEFVERKQKLRTDNKPVVSIYDLEL
jgi:hypothetical protein